jgi:hypothetical protein
VFHWLSGGWCVNIWKFSLAHTCSFAYFYELFSSFMLWYNLFGQNFYIFFSSKQWTNYHSLGLPHVFNYKWCFPYILHILVIINLFNFCQYFEWACNWKLYCSSFYFILNWWNGLLYMVFTISFTLSYFCILSF